MKCPKAVKINDKVFKINTDFRVALKCDQVYQDNKKGEYEKSLAIIFLLYGTDGLNDKNNYDKLLKFAEYYLSCGEEIKEHNREEANMDFHQDMDYIEASFMSDYNIDLENIVMDWWKFRKLINGLTEHCVLNNVRFVRDYDISQIKDSKELNKWIKRKESVALKIEDDNLTSDEEDSATKFYELTGVERK